tara:strand:+ start:383 stop:1537 length:1155 start_codon:yes stop_codon:yes gene_type:complete
MSGNNRTLKINPDLFKLNGKSKKENKGKSVKIRGKPEVDEENSSKATKIKKEMMKKVKDYQKNKEQEVIKEEKEKNKLEKNNLFEKNTFENIDFEREFNKSLNFLQDLAKKNKEKKKKTSTLKNNNNNISSLEINLNLPENLNENIETVSNEYGCLKNGSKPTYRQLNKTQKNNTDLKPKVKIVLENNIYDDQVSKIQSTPEVNPEPKPKPEFIEILDNKIDNLQENLDNNKQFDKLKKETDNISETNQIIELSDKPFSDEISENNILEPFQLKKEQDITLQNIPKIKRTTKKFTYKLGKINGKNRIGVLIKNRETQKNIKHEVSLLKQKSIQDIKNHLRSKNLIKVGSDAPNDVLRKMYEDSLLSGEITNINNNNMVYNYLNE